MIKAIDVKENETAKKVVDLQKGSYTIEANIIGYYEIPPLKDTIASIRQCNEQFFGYYCDNILVGMISYHIEGNCIDICRVAVDPDYFRQGIARSLLLFVEETNKNIKKLLVSTGLKNSPAISLYTRYGFKQIELIESPEGIDLAVFEKFL